MKLERAALVSSNLKAITEEAVMDEVKSLLGYGGVDKAKEWATVVEIFKELDIEPFNNATVSEYKREAAKKLNSSYRDSWGDIRETRGVWNKQLLRNYKGDVPAFALLRAAQVQKALNAANVQGTFYVEELTKRSRKIVVDPFMVLNVCGRWLYLDVWNEPKFEGRRTK